MRRTIKISTVHTTVAELAYDTTNDLIVGRAKLADTHELNEQAHRDIEKYIVSSPHDSGTVFTCGRSYDYQIGV